MFDSNGFAPSIVVDLMVIGFERLDDEIFED